MGKLRFASVTLVATLMVVAGCSIFASRINAQPQQSYTLTLASRHEAGACSNLGTIVFNRVTYALPSTVQVLFDGDYEIKFNSAPGCSFVRWEVEGAQLFVYDPKAESTQIHTDSGGTLRVIYRGTCCGSVGGIMAPVNPLITLAPYLAAIGLVATAAVAVKKRRN